MLLDNQMKPITGNAPAHLGEKRRAPWLGIRGGAKTKAGRKAASHRMNSKFAEKNAAARISAPLRGPGD